MLPLINRLSVLVPLLVVKLVAGLQCTQAGIILELMVCLHMIEASDNIKAAMLDIDFFRRCVFEVMTK